MMHLSNDNLRTLVQTFITSRLDYHNGLMLYGLPKEQIAKLQRVQNAAARLVMVTTKFPPITPVSCTLWITLATGAGAHAFQLRF